MRCTPRTAMLSSVPAAAVAAGLAACLILLIQLGGCTGKGQAPGVDALQPPVAGDAQLPGPDAQPPAATDVPEVSLDSGGTAPEGVDAVLWAKLVDELERVLAEEGTARRTAAAPTGKGSAVPDLGLFSLAGTTYYTWSYRNQGDYDLNGEVNVADLTPVGLHFGKDTLSADWQQAQLADGDGNMEVNIADVTPIGQNFGGRVDGYELQRSPDGTQPYEMMADYGFTAGDATTGLYPPYEHTGPLVIFGPAYRVVPYVDSGGPREYGPVSNLVGSAGGGFITRWHTMRGNNSRDGLARVNGPASVGGTWSVELGGGSEFSLFVEPVVGHTGTIYIGTLSEIPSAETSVGSFHAVSPDGNLEWVFPTDKGVLMPAATNRRGRIVVGDVSGVVYCFAPDGKQIWRRQIAGALIFSGLLLDDQGTVFLLSHVMDWGNLQIISSTLHKLSPDGEVEWNRQLDNGCSGAPFLNPNGDVTVVDDLGKVYSFDYAGVSTFNFTMPDEVSDDMFAKGAMIRTNSIGYSTLSEKVRFHNYDDTFSFTVAPQGEMPVTMPALNQQNHIVFVSRTTVGPEVTRLNYYNGIVEVWDIDLPGELACNVAIDAADRMYTATISMLQVGDGVYCVLPDQTIAWFHPFGKEWVLSTVVASEGLLVCTSVSEEASTGVCKLTGIYE